MYRPSFDFPPWRLSGQVFGVLLNHRPALAALGDAAHAAPYKAPPKAPVLYLKPRNTQVGDGAAVTVPAGVPALEVGAALGLVIGRTACRVAEDQALAHVAGLVIVALRVRRPMPHLVILYTPQLDAETDMGALCRRLADTLLAARDEAGAPVFPVGGTRVLAYPAAHHAVADGSGDHAFCWFNLRMGRGRSDAVHQAVGRALTAAAREHLAPLLASRPVGLTLQIDVGSEVFDAKFGNLHALFAKP